MEKLVVRKISSLEFYFLKISLKNRAFFWIQPNTISENTEKIFKKYGFNDYKVHSGNVDFGTPYFSHSYCKLLFNGHESFTLIATIRNPYTQLFHEYINSGGNKNISFQTYLEKKFQQNTMMEFYSVWERYPDYIIRNENLYDDLGKIPFIKNSEYYYSGNLKEELEKKHKKGRTTEDLKNHINQSVADLIYFNTRRYFDMFDYDKNSWKI